MKWKLFLWEDKQDCYIFCLTKRMKETTNQQKQKKRIRMYYSILWRNSNYYKKVFKKPVLSWAWNPKRNGLISIFSQTTIFKLTRNQQKKDWLLKTERVIRSLPAKQSPGTDGLRAEFYQNIKKDLQSVLLKLFKKV